MTVQEAMDFLGWPPAPDFDIENIRRTREYLRQRKAHNRFLEELNRKMMQACS